MPALTVVFSEVSGFLFESPTMSGGLSADAEGFQMLTQAMQTSTEEVLEYLPRVFNAVTEDNAAEVFSGLFDATDSVVFEAATIFETVGDAALSTALVDVGEALAEAAA